MLSKNKESMSTALLYKEGVHALLKTLRQANKKSS